MSNDETVSLSSEPDADWNNIWTMMQELGAAIAPLMELESPPAWVLMLDAAMDTALPVVEDHCIGAEIDD